MTGRLVEQLAGFDSNLAPSAEKRAHIRTSNWQSGATVSDRPPATHVRGAAHTEKAAAPTAGSAQEVEITLVT